MPFSSLSTTFFTKFADPEAQMEIAWFLLDRLLFAALRIRGARPLILCRPHCRPIRAAGKQAQQLLSPLSELSRKVVSVTASRDLAAIHSP
jgi:hypothetical protein